MNLHPALLRPFRKPVWLWETHRPYPIRERVATLPPIPVATGGPRLVILTTAAGVPDAAWCAYSILRQLAPPPALTLVLDAGHEPPRPARHRWLAALFPGLETIATGMLVARLAPRLPSLARYAAGHPLGRKLCTILALQEDANVLYADADILAFQALPELAAGLAAAAGRPPFYLQDIGRAQTDPGTMGRLRTLGLGHAPTLNTGLLSVGCHALDSALAERILADGGAGPSWFVETTVLAALLHAAGGAPLPRDRYAVSIRRQFIGEPDLDYSTIALRHFVTPVRHLMYSRGMPYLLARWCRQTPAADRPVAAGDDGCAAGGGRKE